MAATRIDCRLGNPKLVGVQASATKQRSSCCSEWGSLVPVASVLAMKMAMIRSLNEGMKPLGTNRAPRFRGVFGGTGGLCSRLENR